MGIRVVGIQIWPEEFKDFVLHRKGVYLDYDQLCDVVRSCGLEVEVLNVSGAGEEFKVSFNGRKYSVASEFIKSEHRWGDGGEFEFQTFLRSEGKNIFVSRRFQSYGTYLDDSMDFSGADVKDTYLFEEDLLGRLVFDCLSK